MSPSNDASVVGAVIAVATLLQTLLLQIINRNTVNNVRKITSTKPPAAIPAMTEQERREMIKEIVREVFSELENRKPLP